MEVLIAVVETEFTEGWLHIVSYSCIPPKDGWLKGTEHTTAPSLCVQHPRAGQCRQLRAPSAFPSVPLWVITQENGLPAVTEEKQDLRKEGRLQKATVSLSSRGWRTWWCWQEHIHRVLAGVKLAVNRRGLSQSCNIPSSHAIWLSTSWLTGGTSLWAQLLMCNTE